MPMAAILENAKFPRLRVFPNNGNFILLSKPLKEGALGQILGFLIEVTRKSSLPCSFLIRYKML